MQTTLQQGALEVTKLAELEVRAGTEAFTTPIRHFVRRRLPSAPGRYLMLLRQRHHARNHRPWRWGRALEEV